MKEKIVSIMNYFYSEKKLSKDIGLHFTTLHVRQGVAEPAHTLFLRQNVQTVKDNTSESIES